MIKKNIYIKSEEHTVSDGGFNLANGGIIGPPAAPPVLMIELEIERRTMCFDEVDTTLHALLNMIIYNTGTNLREKLQRRYSTPKALSCFL